MGSPSDTETGEDIASSVDSDSIINLCGKTSLEEAIDILSMAEKVVSNDSGLMHIASALNRPLIALYGPTSPEFTPPLSRDARILSVKVDCGPCFQRQCPHGHQKCMTQLGVDTVVNELDAIG
jgi:heptosyltransferase-2